MTAYYNEVEPFAAQWLRNLIVAGYIAPGEVDERSINDVQPSDLRGFTQCHFFAGIGVWSHALRSAGRPDARVDLLLVQPARVRRDQQTIRSWSDNHPGLHSRCIAMHQLSKQTYRA